MRTLSIAERGCVWAVLLFGASTAPGCAQPADVGVSFDARHLFAPNPNWRSVDTLPAVSVEQLEALGVDLRHAFLASPAASALRDSGSEAEQGCSFVERALDVAASRAQFRWMPSAGEGRILYTGSSHCSEASVTLIWAREADRWQMAGYAFGEALHVELEPEPAGLFLLRLAACCEDRVDVYRIQSLSDAEPLAQVGVDVQTQAATSVTTPERVTTRREGLLRRSPERDDAPNEMLTFWAEAPVFGNQLDGFKADASGWVSARVKDAGSDEDWCFVSLPRTTEVSPTLGVFSVQAGWTECGHLRADEG